MTTDIHSNRLRCHRRRAEELIRNEDNFAGRQHRRIPVRAVERRDHIEQDRDGQLLEFAVR